MYWATGHDKTEVAELSNIPRIETFANDTRQLTLERCPNWRM